MEEPISLLIISVLFICNNVEIIDSLYLHEEQLKKRGDMLYTYDLPAFLYSRICYPPHLCHHYIIN